MENVLTTSESGDLTSAQILKGVGMVTMNNPHKANCLSSELVSGIMGAFDMFEKASVRAVILRAYTGAKVWSAGHDMKEIPWTTRILLHGMFLLKNFLGEFVVSAVLSSE